VTLSITFRQPTFGPDEAETIAARRFGALGTARPLSSERDQNFLLRLVDGGRVVLKIAHAGEDREVLELQTLALRQLAERVPGLALPRVRTAMDGTEIVEIQGDDGAIHFARLLTWVPGMLLADVRPHMPELLESLGQVIAQVDTGLEGLHHPPRVASSSGISPGPAGSASTCPASTTPGAVRSSSASWTDTTTSSRPRW
jgi:Ser/Thr protein kinase RdoA (MazF antagonist)